MPLWREKTRAFAIHFALTALVALGVASLIFFVWFPYPFQEMAGGARLFWLLFGIELVLGPCLSFIVYDSRKTRLALTVDYTVIALLQLGAFAHGIYNIWETRPAYLVFAKDQIEVVSAGEIDATELAAARDARYRSLPKWGPRFVATHVPPEDKTDALLTAITGKDVALRPKFYVAYDTQLDDIRRQARPLADITAKHPELESQLVEAIERSNVSASNLRWLSIKHRKGFSTALIDMNTGYPVAYLAADAY